MKPKNLIILRHGNKDYFWPWKQNEYYKNREGIYCNTNDHERNYIIWSHYWMTLQTILKTIEWISWFIYKKVIWRPPSLSELTPIIFNMELSHLGSEAFI